MNKELLEALSMLEKEKEISRDALLGAIENSLITALKGHYKSAESVRVTIDRETCEFHVFVSKDVVETEEDVKMDPSSFILLEEALKLDPNAEIGGYVEVEVEVDPTQFGRIAATNAKNVITQKIREEERSIIYNQYLDKLDQIVTGTCQRFNKKTVKKQNKGKDKEDKEVVYWTINLGRADAILQESEMIKTEKYEQNKRMKFYVEEVKNTPKGARIIVSRTHPKLVERLFESEVTEIGDGTVEIKGIVREAGSRAKMAVYSTNPDVDPVGACVGVNGARVNTIVKELCGEKIDIIPYDENPANFIRNALAPAQIVDVFVFPDEKIANVVVPDDQLSLAIGKEGQNARLAAKLTTFKIDIKSETQAKDAYGFRREDYMDEDVEFYDGSYAEDEYEEYYPEDNNSDSQGSSEDEE